MMQRMKMIKNEDGIALVIAIGVVSIMVILAALVAVMAKDTNKTVTHDIRVTESVNVAEAGIDDAVAVTLANYYSVYPGGVIPTGPGDGRQLFDSPQSMQDSQGNTIGSYQVWTKQDPNYPGDVLITSKGTVDSETSPFVSTVRVSVKYASGLFDYAFFSGTPTLDSNTSFSAFGFGGDDEDDGDGDDEDDGGGGNIAVTGKIQVNGNLTIAAQHEGHEHDDDDDHGGHGTVSFFSRTGYTDTARYTKTFTGDRPSGNQPARGSSIPFPTVDFTKFTGANVTTVNLPASGVPVGGWTRSGSTFSISSADFQNAYGGYQVVKLTSQQNGVIVKINGSCGSAAITSTIMVEGVSGATNTRITELDLVGPGLTLTPTNGLAVISGRGLVSLQNEVIVGASDAGALIYLSGQNGTSSFSATNNLVMWGSLIVNGNSSMTAQGQGEYDDDDDDHDDDHDDEDHEHENDHHDDHNSPYCGGADYHGDDDDHHHTTTMILRYDGAYLTNANLPVGWWSWTGGGGFTAVKDNYVRD